MKEKTPKLTHKQKIFVKEYLKEGNGTQAALKAYNLNTKHGTNSPEKVAQVIGSQNLLKPIIANAIEVQQKSLRQALINEGITPEYLAGKVNVLLSAEDPETGKKDYTAIDKGLKHATNIYGIENLDDKPKGNNTYNFIFNSETQEKIKNINETIKAKLINNESN